jgi:hypothetical protein
MRSPTYILRSGSTYLNDLVNGVRAGSILAGTNGVDWYVDPANGSDSNSGRFPDEAFAGIEAAYAATTANQHDVVWYIAGSSGCNLAAAVTWAKNYTHLIGIAAPTRTAQRARIFQTSTLTGASPLFTVSATGCIFSNFYIFQGVDDATSLINVSVTGGRNYFENVHFAGGGHATQAINGGASLLLNGAEENTFVNCTVGVDTVDAATGMVGILFDAEAHRNEFYNCKVRIRAGNAGAAFVEIVDATGIDRDNLFDNCLFINNTTSASLTSGFVIPAGMGAPRKILLKDCMATMTTKMDANDRGVLFGNMDAVTGADLSGVAVELIT